VTTPVFVLIDCNNFFVSCERVFRPDLRKKPVAVLSNNDGVIVARSNEVKALGIPMGVPYFKVRDQLKQHNVVLFSGNFSLYGDFSQRVVQILQTASPDIEVYSVDESFLEISHLPIKNYTAWGRELSNKIKQWTGIPVSVGIAPCKTLAKAAADFAKKNEDQKGAFSVIGDEQKRIDLLKWLPVRDVWGVGWGSAPKLQGRGIKTAYDLSLVSDKWAQEQLTIRGLKTVRELRGESCIPLDNTSEPQQSIARTRSFGHNVRDYYELEGAVATFAASAAVKLRQQGEVTGAVMTFLRTSKHSAEQKWYGSSQVVRLHPPGAETGRIIAAALEGLKQAYDPDFAYKKAGVILLGLTTVQQLAFDSNPADMDRQKALMQTVDHFNNKYNTRLIRHAAEHPENQSWRSKREMRSLAYTTNWRELPKVKV
jgi:DNA polymerase V